MGGVIELLEEVGHEVLQQSIFAVELQKGSLISFKWLSCFELALIINARNDGEFPRFLLVLYLGAIL